MVTILADKTMSRMAQEMYDKITAAHNEAKYFNLQDMKIEPCIACRACEEKVYGRCVVRDDADLILPSFARSRTIIIFTPIVFGGYSFQVKRAIDKISLIGDRHYYYQNGELVKGNLTGMNYYVIGIQDGKDPEEAELFRQFVAETVKIANWTGRAIVMPQDAAVYDGLIKEPKVL